jgi:hypothetical protein
MSSTQSVAGQPGGRTRAEADAPRRAAVLDDLLGQRLQVLEGLRDLVAGLLEGLGRVPHQRFHVRPEEDPVDILLAVRSREGREVGPGRAGGEGVLEPRPGFRIERDERAARREIAREARLGEHRDVRRRARLDRDHDVLLEALGSAQQHFGARRLREIREQVLELGLVLAGRSPGDPQLRAGKVMFGRERLKAVPAERALARGKHEMLIRQRGGRCAAERKCGNTRV